jgi:hypothetical protein
MCQMRRSDSMPLIRSLAITAAALIASSVHAQQRSPAPPLKMPLPNADPAPQRIITQGVGKTIVEDLSPCANTRPGMNLRKNPLGEITATDGMKLTVPTANNFQTGPKLPDLYNECSGVTPKDLSEVDLSKLPIIEIDKDGEIVTSFMVADNYFELFINGKLVGVDATPFTPFNSHGPLPREATVYHCDPCSGLGGQARARHGS